MLPNSFLAPSNASASHLSHRAICDFLKSARALEGPPRNRAPPPSPHVTPETSRRVSENDMGKSLTLTPPAAIEELLNFIAQ